MRFLILFLWLFIANFSFATITFKNQIISDTILQVDSSFPFSFYFINNSSKPIKILNISTNCSCTKAEADKEIYQPNEKGKITGTFEIGDRTGFQSKKIFIETDDKTNPKIVLNLNLTIPLLAEFRPKMLLWRKGANLETKILHIDTAREYGARIQKVSCSNKNFKIDFIPQEEKTDSCEVKFTPLSLNEPSKSEVELECITKEKEKKIYKLYLLVR